MDPSDPPIGNSPCPAPWLPSSFYAVTYNNKTYRLRPMLSFFLAHDSAYRRNYAPDFAVWVQGCASQHLVCRTCRGKHFTQDCGEDFGPWDSALFMEELTEFWFCCEQYSRNYELTRTDSTVVPSVPDTPPLSAPAAPAAAPPPAAPLPVPERVLPRTTRLASTNRRDKATHEIHVRNFNTWLKYVVEFNAAYEAEGVLRYVHSSRPKVWTAIVTLVKAAAKGELHQATLKAKHQTSFLVPDPQIHRIYPAPKQMKDKSDRGITHGALVHFLLSCMDRQKLPTLTFTPADITAVPDEEGQQILDDITRNKKNFDNSFYPSAFFHDFTAVGPGHMSDGLFESIAILGRLYWLGAGHAYLGLCGQPIPPVCPARRHGVYQFTGRMLGHVLCQLRTMLSTADWSKKDGLYDYEALFNKIVSIFYSEDPAVKAWANKILAALTKAIFNDQEILNFDAALHKYHDAGDDLLAEIMGGDTVLNDDYFLCSCSLATLWTQTNNTRSRHYPWPLLFRMVGAVNGAAHGSNPRICLRRRTLAFAASITRSLSIALAYVPSAYITVLYDYAPP
ncbi:hypothetical protein MKEN_00602500 [Mycena kentingensis (nom. inval.)]|nr:hypothetical protein MKEN_00602500 [Mycena kentingensis (nom. inval.)]